MAWAFTLWSLTCVAHAFAQGAFSLGICRFFLGGFEAANYPAGIKAVGEWFPPKDRTIATGIFSAGSGLGAIIAPPLIAWLILRFGWQAAFIAPGAVGLLWLLPWLLIYNEKYRTSEPPNLAPTARSKRPDVPAGSWRLIFQRREFWGIFFARMLTDPVWWFYIFWLPKYLSSERGFDLAQIALFAWVPFVGSDIFSVVGGFFPAFLINRGMDPICARKVAMLLSAACMPMAILAVNTPTALAAVLFISVATSGHAFFTSSLLTLPADLFPKNLVATTYGLTAAGGTVGGILMSVYVGEMLSTIGYHPVFLVIGSLHVVAAIVLFLTIRPPQSALT
jgi:ACS family hexuronate transporter-like MFS transporter